jgi:hypothetical protein
MIRSPILRKRKRKRESVSEDNDESKKNYPLIFDWNFSGIARLAWV